MSATHLNYGFEILHKSKKQSFIDYLSRLFREDYTLMSFFMSYANDEIVLSGKILFDLYQGYLTGQTIRPKKWIFFVSNFEQNGYPLVYNLKDNQYCWQVDFDLIKILQVDQRENVRFVRCEPAIFFLNAISKIHHYSHYEIAYAIKSKKLFIGEGVKHYLQTRQISFISNIARIDSDIKSIIRHCRYHNVKHRIGYFNYEQELNILFLKLIVKKTIDSSAYKFLHSSVKIKDRLLNELEDIQEAISLSNYFELIKENDNILDFLLRGYYMGGKSVRRALCELSNYPKLFQFLYFKANENIFNFRDIYQKDISRVKLSFIEKYLWFDEIRFFLNSSEFAFWELVDDLYFYRKQLKKYTIDFLATLDFFNKNYKQERICAKKLYVGLSKLITSGQLFMRYKKLNSPLPLVNVNLPKGVIVRELLSVYHLRREGIEMDNCLGWNGVDVEIAKGVSRVFSLMVDGQRYSMQLVLVKNKFNVEEIRGHHNSRPDQKIIKIANYIVDNINVCNNINKKIKQNQKYL